jgi:hypothetical protein
MNRQDVICCSEDELDRALLPIDDEMHNQGVPTSLRAMKGWHLFMAKEQLDISLRDPASDRVITWFRLHPH